MSDLSDDELLAELGVSIEPTKAGGHSPREERIIAGFDDIQRFFDTHGHAPQHGEERDIFERLYAVRLDRLRALPEARELLAGMDVHGLLAQVSDTHAPDIEALNDEALLAELGVGEPDEDDITVLRHISSHEERRLAEEIANREKCEDFEKFEPLFREVQTEALFGCS